MRLMVVALIAAAALAGCGPSAQEVQQRRVCEMYGDEGGQRGRSLEEWERFLDQPDQAANKALTERITAGTQYTAAQWEKIMADARDAEAAVRVARRLALSMREVDAALAKCGPKGGKS